MLGKIFINLFTTQSLLAGSVMALLIAALVVTAIIIGNRQKTGTMAVTTDVRVADDAYVVSGSPNNNFGRSDSLNTQYSERINKYFYLRFEIKGFTDISKAELYLYCSKAPNNVQEISVYKGKSNDWSENTLTYNNCPGYEETPIALINTTPEQKGWYSIDLSNHITGNGIYSFAIRGKINSQWNFASKENAIFGIAPHLKITHNKEFKPSYHSTAEFYVPNGVTKLIQPTTNTWRYYFFDNGYIDDQDAGFSECTAYDNWQVGEMAWKGRDNSADMGSVFPDGMQPGQSGDAALGFIAPISGTINISKSIASMMSKDSDGTDIRILHNENVIWPADGSWYPLRPGTPVTIPAKMLCVERGDVIRFVSNIGSYNNPNATADNDRILWKDIKINYAIAVEATVDTENTGKVNVNANVIYRSRDLNKAYYTGAVYKLSDEGTLELIANGPAQENNGSISFQGSYDGEKPEYLIFKLYCWKNANNSMPCYDNSNSVTQGLVVQSSFVAKIFGDNMVLQRGVKVPIFGDARNNKSITVTANGQTKTAAITNGRWRVDLDPMDVGEPFEVKVIGDVEQKTFTNVVMGEVWNCAGQSNMRVTLKGTDDEEAILAVADNPNIRTFVFKKDGRIGIPWSCMNQNLARNSTAIGIRFAVDLYNKFNEGGGPIVPIGFINTAVGATSAQAWMSEETLRSDPDFTDIVQTLEKGRDMTTFNFPAHLFNVIIKPIAHYAIKGVIWYQGAGNSTNPTQYYKLLPDLISDWRTVYENPDLYFFISQLAPYKGDKEIPNSFGYLREAQLLTRFNIKNSGLVVAIDTGDEDNNHSRYKRALGQRFALLARKFAYGESTLQAEGPLYTGYEIQGNKIIVSFRPDTLGSGLVFKGDKTGFEICGEDGNYVEAQANIINNGTQLEIFSPSIPNPTAARYGFRNFPIPAVTLANKEGIPASTFRTATDRP